MMAQNHLLIGAVLGLYISNPYLVVILSLLSHFVMDLFPYFILKGKSAESTKKYFKSLTKDIQYLTRFIITLQIVIVIFTLVILYQNEFILLRNVQLGMFFAILPDIIKHFLQIFKINWKHHTFFIKLPRDVHTVIHTIVTLLLLFLVIAF